jgi:hypothetical protein
MNSSATISDPLNHHLSTHSTDDQPGLGPYIDRGATLVDAALRRLRATLVTKMNALPQPGVLHRQLGLLLTFFDASSPRVERPSPALGEVTFALLYFLKGFDRIPDTVPEIGLLDDALIVQTVLQRQAVTLRAHALRSGRDWTENF